MPSKHTLSGTLQRQVRDIARGGLNWGHRLRARAMTRDELCASAVVFAPHPDDETLGCGGTIVAKRRCGARVVVVFVTDGARSHQSLMAPSQLSMVRNLEAFRATSALGVDATDVCWLGFEDGSLQAEYGRALERVADVLDERKPTQVFLPYHMHEHPDHALTREIVLDALKKQGASVATYEYPVWYMNQWPWVGASGDRSPVAALRDNLKQGFGLRLLRDFDVVVDLEAFATVKQSALSAHRTQVEKFNGDPAWVTLGEIYEGEFLRCFFEMERFRSGRMQAGVPI